MLASSTEPSLAQQRFAQALRLYGAPGLDSQEKRRLNTEQVELLLKRVSDDERKDVMDTRLKCFNHAVVYRGLPFTALALGSLFMVHARRPSMYYNRSGLMKCLYYAQYPCVGFLSFWVATNIGGWIKCQEIVRPKIALLWQKYGVGDFSGVRFIQLSPAQQRFASILRMSAVPEFNPQGKLDDEQIQYLYNQLSSSELKDFEETLSKCFEEPVLTRGIPCLVVYYVLLLLTAKWLPAKYRFRLKGWPKCVCFLFCLYLSLVASMFVPSIFGYVKNCKERIPPKVAQWLQKYGGDESTTNYADSTVALHSDTFIPGAPSGVPRERREKNGDQTKKNSYGDEGFS